MLLYVLIFTWDWSRRMHNWHFLQNPTQQLKYIKRKKLQIAALIFNILIFCLSHTKLWYTNSLRLLPNIQNCVMNKKKNHPNTVCPIISVHARRQQRESLPKPLLPITARLKTVCRVVSSFPLWMPLQSIEDCKLCFIFKASICSYE